MDLLTELFEILGFDDIQKRKAFNDLDKLVKTKLIEDLTYQLPENIIDEIKEIGKKSTKESQEKISSIIKSNFSDGEIKEFQEKVMGFIVLQYIAHMYNQVTSDEQEKIKQLLSKHHVNIQV